jgi:hypothetical protein
MIAAGVGVVVGGLGIVGRTLQAAAKGDTSFVDLQITASLIGALSLVVFLMVFSVRFLPGQLRARELRVRFPSDLVLTGRVGYSVAATLRQRMSLSRAAHLPRVPFVSFGITASDLTVSFWGGSRKPRLLESVAWSEIQSVGISPRVAVGSEYPALWIECFGSYGGLHFRVTSSERFGSALARSEVVTDLAATMEAMRTEATGKGEEDSHH